jgi:predicted phosphoadenosine phosphosulfate sulfurtransferase
MDNFPVFASLFLAVKTLQPCCISPRSPPYRQKICVLFIDWEAQFSCTIAHCEKCAQSIGCYRAILLGRPAAHHPEIPDAVSAEWQCWEPGARWVRQPPPDAITDPGYFPFYQPGMSFETFVRQFAEWFSQPSRRRAGGHPRR